MLLLHAGEVVTRDRLVDALWADEPPDSAPRALQVYVHGLRRVLGAERIETHGTGYRIAVEQGELDLERFERLVELGRRALAAGDAADAAEHLRRAVELWAGAPLADLAGEPIARMEAGRLNELRLAALESRNDAELALGRHDALLAELESLVSEEPFRERLREQHILALYRAGRQKDALDAYRAGRQTLVDELGIEPGAALQELERGILRHDPLLAAPAPAPAGVKRLPTPPTALVGRRLEVAAVAALLRRDDVRLVTLTGPGGTGKTRLGLAVAEELAEEFRDGVAFVDLAPVGDATLLATAIAGTLGVKESEQPVAQALLDHLRGKSALLLLDNFEHLLPGALLVSELLAGAPRLVVLATSRAPLRLYGEHEYPVPPFEPPDRRRDTTFEQVIENDAVRLFVARLRAVDPAFELTEASASDVAEICWRLDGLPLAIELAAARGKLLPPATLVQGLEQALDLLTGGPRDLPHRQQTLRAALDWSYDLLSESERVLFGRLAVFSGGCTIGAVESVCADDKVDLLAVFASLVEVSLLHRVGEDRFAMLETIREYAIERLKAAGEEDSVRLRHAEYFTSLAEDTEQKIPAGADPAPLLRRLETEHDNLRAALRYLQQQAAAEPALRLASSLTYFWRVRAYLSEGRAWLENALALEGDVPPALRAKSLSSAGRLTYRQGDYMRARQLHQQALDIARATGDLRAVGQALSDLGGVSSAEGDRDRAEALYIESAEVLRAADYRVRLGTVLGNLAGIRLGRGDTKGAHALADEALNLQKESGDKEGRVSTYLTLAAIAAHEHRNNDAEHALRHSLALIHELDYRELQGHWFMTCAELALTQGNIPQAVRLVGAADAAFERVNISQLHARDRQLRDDIIEAALHEVGQETLHTTLLEGRQTSEEDALPA
jgi:predicted ATPase/DNA-binding SARP family transcriptional activator